MSKKIMVVGTFDVENYGDCLFPELVKNELGSRIENCQFNLYSPSSNVAEIGCYNKVNSLPGTYQDVLNLNYDVVILAGGETINCGHAPKGMYCSLPLNTMSAGMRLWAVPAIMKLEKGITTIINGVGVGHLQGDVGFSLDLTLRNADYVTVRDHNSLKRLNLSNVKFAPKVDTDSAFTLPNLCTESGWDKKIRSMLPENLANKSYIVVQGRLQYLKKNYHVWEKSIIKIAKTLNSNILLLPICYHHSDILAVNKIHSKLKKNNQVLVGKIDKYIKTNETAALIAGSIGYCGTSLHGTITAVAFCKPFVTIAPFNSKYDGVLQNLGIDGCVVNNYNDIERGFFHTPDNYSNKVKNAIKMAESAFDDIAQLINNEDTRSENHVSHNSLLNKKKLKETIDYDSLYYRRKKHDLLWRLIFKAIRKNSFLNSSYDNFSSWKNRHTKI